MIKNLSADIKQFKIIEFQKNIYLYSAIKLNHSALWAGYPVIFTLFIPV